MYVRRNVKLFNLKKTSKMPELIGFVAFTILGLSVLNDLRG